MPKKIKQSTKKVSRKKKAKKQEAEERYVYNHDKHDRRADHAEYGEELGQSDAEKSDTAHDGAKNDKASD